MTIEALSWEVTIDSGMHFTVLSHKEAVVVSITNTPTPALIVQAEPDEEPRILLGNRQSEISVLLVSKLAELFFPRQVVALLGFREELNVDDLREIVEHVKHRCKFSSS